MRCPHIDLFSLVLLCFGVMAYTMVNEANLIPTMVTPASNPNSDPMPMSNQLKLKIGSSTFTATLLNSATVRAFNARLPMTVNMSELNGNEKFCTLSTNLPINSSNPGTIHTGDLMLYGSNTLVLFYKSFSTTYSYTKLGRIDNPSGLVTALGSGSATVSFESDQ